MPAMVAQPIAKSIASSNEFLHHFLSASSYTQENERLLLIICQDKDQFLESLFNGQSSSHYTRLLHPTLNLLAGSQRCSIVFTPTVTHLRAQLSRVHNEGSVPLVAIGIWHFVEAHWDSSDFSAQGIGRTAAAIISAGQRSNSRVIVCGPAYLYGKANATEIDLTVPDMMEAHGRTVAHVPLMNPSTRLGIAASAVSQRAFVHTSAIIGRWFAFT